MSNKIPKVGDTFKVAIYGESGYYHCTVVYVEEEFQEVVVKCPELKTLQIMTFWGVRNNGIMWPGME